MAQLMALPNGRVRSTKNWFSKQIPKHSKSWYLMGASLKADLTLPFASQQNLPCATTSLIASSKCWYLVEAFSWSIKSFMEFPYQKTKMHNHVHFIWVFFGHHPYWWAHEIREKWWIKWSSHPAKHYFLVKSFMYFSCITSGNWKADGRFLGAWNLCCPSYSSKNPFCKPDKTYCTLVLSG